MKDGGILMDAGTREVFSKPGIIGGASIEPHLLARVCNNVRGVGYSGAADCGGAGAVRVVRGGIGSHMG